MPFLRHLSVALVVLGLIIASTAPAIGQTSSLDTNDPLVQDAQVYASDQGISLEEAVRRLQIIRAEPDLEAKLIANEGKTFAGLWVQHQPAFRIVVQFTRNGEQTIQPYIKNGPWAAIVEVRHVPHSFAKLRADQDRAVRTIRGLGLKVGADIDLVHSRVKVSVPDRMQLEAALQRAGVQLPDTVTVDTFLERNTDEANLSAGLSITDCTSGFSVYRTSNSFYRGIVTAAHCPDVQSYQGVALTFQSQKNAGTTDAQWNDRNSYTVKNWATDNSNDATPYYRLITGYRSRDAQLMNDFVCKWGRTTGYTCGYIVSKVYQPPTWATGTTSPTATYIRIHRDGVDLSQPGDSGGPWYAGEIALGIHKGSTHDNEFDAYYTAINYVMSDLGVTVLTSSN